MKNYQYKNKIITQTFTFTFTCIFFDFRTYFLKKIFSGQRMLLFKSFFYVIPINKIAVKMRKNKTIFTISFLIKVDILFHISLKRATKLTIYDIGNTPPPPKKKNLYGNFYNSFSNEHLPQFQHRHFNRFLCMYISYILEHDTKRDFLVFIFFYYQQLMRIINILTKAVLRKSPLKAYCVDSFPLFQAVD